VSITPHHVIPFAPPPISFILASIPIDGKLVVEIRMYCAVIQRASMFHYWVDVTAGS
jgi:hypothetical protein